MRNTDRKAIIPRIIKILEIINHPIKTQLEQSITLFSAKELFQIAQFLETGNLNTIDQFIEDKKQEYIDLINKIKIEKKLKNISYIKKIERRDSLIEKQELLKINFN